MDCRFKNPKKKAGDHEALMGFKWVLTRFYEDTCGGNNEMVVGEIEACKLVMHSGRYPIPCENLLTPNIGWFKVITVVLFDHVHGIEAYLGFF